MSKNPYTAGGYEKAKIKKAALLVFSVIATIILITFMLQASNPERPQDKNTQNATAAARKETPGAEAQDVKVAGGFALATVNVPGAEGQLGSGNTTIFKVNKDGSMVQIASGSSFNALDLLQFGIPFTTQAKLTGSTLEKVKQNLVEQCGTSETGPGYSGFDGSFNPDGWQIDTTTLSLLASSLSSKIATQNSAAQPGKNVVCVNALRKNSDVTVDKKTYVSTFTLQVQFITSDGTLTDHTVTFTLGSKNYRQYTLDGQTI